MKWYDLHNHNLEPLWSSQWPYNVISIWHFIFANYTWLTEIIQLNNPINGLRTTSLLSSPTVLLGTGEMLIINSIQTSLVLYLTKWVSSRRRKRIWGRLICVAGRRLLLIHTFNPERIPLTAKTINSLMSESKLSIKKY